MKKATFKKLVMTSICCLLLSAISFSQELIYEISLQEQVRESSQIIEGKVISQNSVWDANHNNIYTINTVKVYKVFKGQPLTTIEVVTRGGIVGLEAEIVSPSLQLSKGDLGVFMLHNSNLEFANGSSNMFKPYSSIQGFYVYNLVENTAVNPFNIKRDISTSFYSEITNLTNSGFVEITPFSVNDSLIVLNTNRDSASVLASISSISPTTATAGTKTVLTITGSLFGTTQGTVGFRDGNNGGASYYTALDTQVISWTDTEIQVEIPSRAGTGTVLVTNHATEGGGSTTSSQTLTIDYAQINVSYDLGDGSGTKAYQTSHIDDDTYGGYTWQMHTDFDTNTAAKESFMRAFDTWRCETGVNWTIGAVTTTDVAALDGINIIRFDNGAELASGVLGVCSSRFGGCIVGPTLEWFISELDIVFNDSTNWQFGPANASASQIDFETVAVHELGHGHQLAHVINTSAIMHYALGGGDNNRVLSANDIAGAGDVQSRSTTLTPCGSTSMTAFDCAILSNDDLVLLDGLDIYPNPAKNNLYIKNTSYINLENVTVNDISGRFILKKEINSTSTLTTINTSSLSKGLYFITVATNNGDLTKKIIID